MISIVIPVFNEEESLNIFYQELEKSLNNLSEKYEIIFVDDGSTDSSLIILKSFLNLNKNVKILSFRRNYGKAEALTIGFKNANGDYIVTLDADLQDLPSEISKLLKKTREGWDFVSGWRRYRKDPFFKVLSSKIFNFLAKKIWGLKLHDYNCGLKAFSRDAAKSLNIYGGFHRFIPVLLHSQGFSVTELEVNHSVRKFGKSKYSFSKLWKDLPDIFTMIFLSRYSRRPFHFFGTFGVILILMGIIILTYLSIIHFYGERIGTRPLLFFGMLLVLSGFQIFFTGFLADLLISVFQKKENNSDDEFLLLKYSSLKNKL